MKKVKDYITEEEQKTFCANCYEICSKHCVIYRKAEERYINNSVGVAFSNKSAQAAATARYDAKNTRQINLKLNLKTDADVLNKLDQVENKQGYIKDLILKDLQNEK